MKNYFYVEARKVDGMVSFHHIAIQARNDTDAYTTGGRKMLQQRDFQLKAGLDESGHFTGQFLNDYVIQVPA